MSSSRARVGGVTGMGRGSVGGLVPKSIVRAAFANQNKPSIDAAALFELAYQIFVIHNQDMPNALGEAAYLCDTTGKFYEDATKDKRYYPRSGDIETLKQNLELITNRARDIETVYIIGPGPKEVFLRKEGMLIKGLPNVRSIVTIDLSAEFNNQAKIAVNELAEDIGRSLLHSSYTMDYKAAAEKIRAERVSNRHLPPGLVLSTGGLITNIKTNDHTTFPVDQFKLDLKAMASIAGPCGFLMVTYDSNDDENSLVKAYRTEALRQLYLNVIDKISELCPGFSGLDSKKFTVVSTWNKEAQAVDHKLVVKEKMELRVPYKMDTRNGKTYFVTLLPGTTYNIISSYKPDVERVKEAANAVSLEHIIAAEHKKGPTAHFFQNRCGRSSTSYYGCK